MANQEDMENGISWGLQLLQIILLTLILIELGKIANNSADISAIQQDTFKEISKLK